MLLWEIDRSLTELTEFYGFGVAGLSRQPECRRGVKSLVLQLGLPCEMRDRNRFIWQPHAMLLDVFGITRAAALVSPGAADADPMQLARGLLSTAVSRCSRQFEAEANAFDVRHPPE
jgi:hypothetical protein